MASSLPAEQTVEAPQLKIRVLVADNHKLVRDGLRFAFQNTEIHVVAEATDRAAAVRLAQEEPIDLVLLDIGWPDRDSSLPDGFQVLREVLDLKPELPILIYSMHDRESYKSRGRELGACGYVVKGVANKTLIEAVRRANGGEESWFEYNCCCLSSSGESRGCHLFPISSRISDQEQQ